MGFTLKKILSAFLMPLSIGLLLFCLGLFYLYTHSYKKAKFYLTVSFVWIALMSYAPVSNSLLKPLESAYETVDISQIKAKYILLLGGDFEGRAYEALRLHHSIHGSFIITSGYAGLGKEVSEALINANRLMQLGVKKEHIIMQKEPRDTKEEALHIKKMLGDTPFLLVTSAYHMPRAMSIFEKEGLNAIAAPTNYLIKPLSSITVPSGHGLYKTDRAWHEYMGLAWNALKSSLE